MQQAERLFKHAQERVRALSLTGDASSAVTSALSIQYTNRKVVPENGKAFALLDENRKLQ
jgi:hypothetical protein